MVAANKWNSHMRIQKATILFLYLDIKKYKGEQKENKIKFNEPFGKVEINFYQS